jgi:hypothetical protein
MQPLASIIRKGLEKIRGAGPEAPDLPGHREAEEEEGDAPE